MTAAYLTVPDGAKVTAAGLVAASGAGGYDPSEELTAANADYVKSSSAAVGKGAPVGYTWSKTAVGPGDVWYLRARVAYVDAAGEAREVYGERVRVAAGEDYDASERGTAAIRSAGYDAGAGKATFVSYLTVPDGGTIVRAGLVAASGAGFDPGASVLTAANADYVKSSAAAVGRSAPVSYTWTKTKVGAGDTWYARAYLVYTDASGREHAVYGGLVTVRA